MKRAFIILIFLLPCYVFAQQKHILSGYVYEKGSMESLPCVTIYLPEYNLGTYSNGYGFYSITYPATDSIVVIYRYLSFDVDTLKLASAPNLSLNKVMSSTLTLRTVTVLGERKSTEEAQMSTHIINYKEIKNIPALLGEKDLFKTLLLLPGIASGTEGMSGIFVRGGSPDQNLIILDEATIYNVNHLLGFFSIFNGNAIKSAEIVKGGFPARYGGRLSSVIDIKMKEGNKESYHGEGGVGILSGNFMVEGPIVKNRSSFMLSGRRTWFDLLSRPIMAAKNPDVATSYFFYDLNAKFNYDFGNKDKLFISGYFGRDKFFMKNKYSDEEGKGLYTAGLYWQNGLTSVRWNHLFFNKLFSNLSFIFSDYTMNTYQKSEIKMSKEKKVFSFDFNSGIRDYTLKYDITYIPNSLNHILIGALCTYHEARPNAVQSKSDTSNYRKKILEQGFEYAFYVEDEINIKNKLRINPGLRFDFFSVPHKTYFLPEPRVSISYNFRKDLSIKTSYAMMNQFMLLLSPSTIGLPTDLWVPVTKGIRPQRSQQVALGVVYEPERIKMTFSIEGYYKKMDHIIAYTQGANFLLDGLEMMGKNTNLDWESKITKGQSWAYGIEFLARRSVGKVSGWIAYTLSWVQQQFDALNNGKKFWGRYDRRHDISLVLMYSPTKLINLSLSWVYATGNALTLPNETYQLQGLTEFFNMYSNAMSGLHNPDYELFFVDNFISKNNFRTEPFHHLDIGVQFIKPHKKKKNFESIFEISVYNVYCHKNPFIYIINNIYKEDANGSGEYQKQLAKVTIFPIIPSFSYSFRF